MADEKIIKFTGQFSLLSAIAVIVFCVLVYGGHLPWWSFLIAWLYQMNFITVDLKKLFGQKKTDE